MTNKIKVKPLVIENVMEAWHVVETDRGQGKVCCGFGYPRANMDFPSLFVRLHSFSETRNHRLFDSLIGKRLRITIEVME